jgi:hypothetical protein
MTSHLTFEELIDGTGRHDGCPDCEAEAAEWSAIRAGVRLQAGAPSAQVLPSVLANSTKTRRYLIPLSAVAAAAVLAAGSYGVVVALGHGSARANHAGTAALTATGCTGLELAGGTLTQVNGDELVISGTEVVAAGTTAIYRETTGSLADITDGRRVFVTGTLDGETIAAKSVGVLPDSVTSPASPATPAMSGGLGIGLANGTVTDAHDGGFTVIEADGTRLAITTSASLIVINTQRISLTQLVVGEVTSAVGTAGGDGTLTATTVEQDAVPAAIWQKLLPAVLTPSGVPSDLPTPSSSLNGLGCSPAAITTTYLLRYQR